MFSRLLSFFVSALDRFFSLLPFVFPYFVALIVIFVFVDFLLTLGRD